MKGQAGERTQDMGRLWQRGTDIGVIADMYGVQRPAVWRALRRLGLLPPYQPSKRAKRTYVRHIAIPETICLPTPVDRDPCTYCGVRGDIGCRHNRRAA